MGADFFTKKIEVSENRSLQFFEDLVSPGEHVWSHTRVRKSGWPSAPVGSLSCDTRITAVNTS